MLGMRIGWLAMAGYAFVLCGQALSETPVDADGGAPVLDNEASLMVVELFEENRDLRSRLEVKEREVEALQRQLAETMTQLDLTRVPKPESRVAEAVSANAGDGVMVDEISRVRVLEINRDMQVAVVSGGRRAGMKNGMRFYVLRDDRMIGQLKVIEVRDNVAGGLIERVEKGSFPETGDRLILASKQDG
jgi:hypothetical protein